MPKAEQPPDSILLVALRILAGTNVPTTEDVLRNALRLINNCCQGDGELDRLARSYFLTQLDGNRQIVLNNNGVSRMMSLAYRRVEPDFVVPALYNICLDHEPATRQLIHWKGGNSDTRAGPNLEDNFWEASPSEGALQVLLSLADALWHEERKPLLADLLELASQSGSSLSLQD
jgi:hypothetical protein